MKIDTANNFSKVVGSFKKALKLLSSILDNTNTEGFGFTTARKKRSLLYAKGENKKFSWYYDGDSKTLTVRYTDGRPAPVETKPKETYYIIWIEGLSARYGEKLCSLTDAHHTYTLKMTKALRVKPEDLQKVKGMLLSQGVAGWALNENSFIKTHYAPKGTLYNQR